MILNFKIVIVNSEYCDYLRRFDNKVSYNKNKFHNTEQKGQKEGCRAVEPDQSLSRSFTGTDSAFLQGLIAQLFGEAFLCIQKKGDIML